MDQETKQLIETKMEEMSPKLRTAIDSVDVNKVFQRITSEFSLHVDIADRLYILVWFILLGMEDTENLVETITEIEGIESGQAQQLAQSFENMIFKPVRDLVITPTKEDKLATTPKKEPLEEGASGTTEEKMTAEKPSTPQNLPTEAPKNPEVQESPEQPSPTPQEEGVEKKEEKEAREVSPAPQAPRYGSDDPYRESLDKE